MIEKIKGLEMLKKKIRRLSKEDLLEMRGGDDHAVCKTFCAATCTIG